VLAIIGTGKQALPQVAAVAAVRPIREVRVHSPNPEHRDALVHRIGYDLSITAVDVPSVGAAVEGADIITLATRANSPFLAPSMVSPGAHINAIGAITPERAEFDPALLERAAVVTADSVEQARRLSAELRDWDAITPLCELVAAGQGRPAGADITLLKAMGMGISDLALGLAVLRAAEDADLGRPIPGRERAPLRLRSRLRS